MSGVGRIGPCVLFGSLFVASPAYGDDGFALSWRTDESSRHCVSSTALRKAVEQRLGRHPFTDPEHASVWIEGEETALGRDQFRARVTQRDRNGVSFGARELEPQSCSGLLRAAVLVVSLFIDRHRDEGFGDEAELEPLRTPPPIPQPPRPEPSPPVPPADRPRAPRGPRAPAPNRRASTLELLLGGGVSASVGLLPSVDGALFAAGRLEPSGSRWSFAWRAGYHLPQRIEDRSVSGRFSAIEQRLDACVSPARWPTTRLDVCGGFVWGAVIPQTSGTNSGNDSWRVIAGPAFALALQVGGRPTAGRIELGLMLPFREYTFVYTDPDGKRKSFYSTDEVLFVISISGLRTIS